MLETHVPTSTLGEYVSFHVLFKPMYLRITGGKKEALYGLSVFGRLSMTRKAISHNILVYRLGHDGNSFTRQ